MKRHLHRLTSLRLLWLVLIYSLATTFSLWFSYQLRFDFAVPPDFRLQCLLVLCWVIPLRLAAFYLFRQFSEHLTFFSTPDLRRLFSAVVTGSGIMLVSRLVGGLDWGPPRSVIIADFIVLFMSVAGFRLLLRTARERAKGGPIARGNGTLRRVGIVGAGDVGAKLAREFLVKRHLGVLPVAFFDDNKSIWRCRVHGVPVMGPPEILLYTDAPRVSGKGSLFKNLLFSLFEARRPKLSLDEVIIAMPSASARRIREVVEVLRKANLKFKTVPSMDQLATGKVSVSQIRPVEIHDLLGREHVQLENSNIRGVLVGKTIMVTGAGGSIGSELCRQIATFGPAKLLLVDRSEPHLFAIEQELLEQGAAGVAMPLVADIMDRARMAQLFETHRPEVIFHAAAHKHVPMMERQPAEAIKNNVFGTAQMAELAVEHGVGRFILISTDKAVNPTSVMGATKRLAEIFVQSLHSHPGNKTKIMAVRFGNVLGSSGSVVPIFTRQIATGGPIKVTHPDITRYFMTIPEAASLVLQSSALGKGGEIFVLDMGNPVKILDLAHQMVELSGLRVNEDIEIVITGLRPGEKLYEELIHHGENIAPTENPKIMRFVSQPLQIATVRRTLSDLRSRLQGASTTELKAILKSIIPEYCPFSGGDQPAPSSAPPAAIPFQPESPGRFRNSPSINSASELEGEPA